MSSRDARLLAQSYYEGSGRRFEDDLIALALSPAGVAVCTPRLVALMKAVRSDSDPLLWMDGPEDETPDAWYIHLLAGDLDLAFAWARGLPPLRYFCFQRGLRSERYHILPWGRLPSPATGIHSGAGDNNTNTNHQTWDSNQK